MNKPFKTLALLVSAVTVIPAIAIDPKAIRPGDVIGTIGGDTKQVQEGDVVGTIGGKTVQITSEKEAAESKSKLQRLCSFLSRNKETLIYTAFGVATCILLYRIFGVHMAEIRKIEQLKAEAQKLNQSATLLAAIDNALDESKDLLAAIKDRK